MTVTNYLLTADNILKATALTYINFRDGLEKVP